MTVSNAALLLIMLCIDSVEELESSNARMHETKAQLELRLSEEQQRNSTLEQELNRTQEQLKIQAESEQLKEVIRK